MAAGLARILVAEDNLVLSRVIQFNLEQAGYQVTVAANGAEAIKHLESASFELLLTDYQMPLVDGAGICDHVRVTLQNHDLPIILCSAKGLELDFARLQERWQLAGLFYKPFSLRELLQHIGRIVAPETQPA